MGARVPKDSPQPRTSTTPLLRTKHQLTGTSVPFNTEMIAFCKWMLLAKLFMFCKRGGLKYHLSWGQYSTVSDFKPQALPNALWGRTSRGEYLLHIAKNRQIPLKMKTIGPPRGRTCVFLFTAERLIHQAMATDNYGNCFSKMIYRQISITYGNGQIFTRIYSKLQSGGKVCNSAVTVLSGVQQVLVLNSYHNIVQIKDPFDDRDETLGNLRFWTVCDLATVHYTSRKQPFHKSSPI